MNRTQRRKMEKDMKKKKISFDKNPRVPHLIEIDKMMKPITGGFVFDRVRISQDNRLYMLYNLPNDDIMKLIVEKNIENFETMLEQEKVEIKDIVKLDLYMTFFEGCHKEGFFMERYNELREVSNILTRLFEENED